jgi:hypothetical protein
MPTFVVPSDVIDTGLLSLASPLWATGGLAMSGVFLMMARLNANSIVGEISLIEKVETTSTTTAASAPPQQQHRHPKNLLIKTHNFLGMIENEGKIYEPWNGAAGASISEYKESKNMITYLPKSDTPTYHRIIDTLNGDVKDKVKLLNALERCRANTPGVLESTTHRHLNKNRSSGAKRDMA